MGLLTLDGIYKNGKVELCEPACGVDEPRVTVTFLDTDAKKSAERREELRQRFFARLRRGVDFGDEPISTREELYADRLNRFL